MCTYLIKRGSTYAFRRRVPAKLVPFVGVTEFTYSLETKDRDEASELHHAAVMTICDQTFCTRTRV
ncbi:DUF6538 domain-containing protein [Sphingobium aquiterrae]|uniref:DUF6538 domain-containing protein n=1 Tax=Sphingobium aquiterrae TaxID=2038656 RepID=UPI00301ACD46